MLLSSISPLQPTQNEVTAIETAVDLILGQFQDAIATAFHFFHQRRADLRNIRIEHIAAADALADVQKRVIAACRAAEVLYSQSFGPMLFLDTLKQITVEKSTALQDLLRSEKHWTDLKFFKEVVAELDSLSNWGNPLDYVSGYSHDQKVEKFKELHTKVTSNNENYLHKDLLNYTLYVAEQLKIPGYEKLAQLPTGGETFLKGKLLLLPAEKFRTGQTAAHVRYRDVTDVTNELERVELSLKEQELLLIGQMRQVCMGELNEVTCPVDHIPAINRCFNSLVQKSFSTHVHAGWYYENAVRIHAAEVSVTYERFQTIFRESLEQNLIAARALEKADVCSAVQAYPKHPVLNRQINSLLEYTEQEASLHTQIFSRLKRWDDTVRSYLHKGLIRNIYHRHETEFAAMFSMLKYDPAYRDDFAACLKSDEELSALHDDYVAKTSPKKVSPLILEFFEPLPAATPNEALLLRLLAIEQGHLKETHTNSWLEKKIEQEKQKPIFIQNETSPLGPLLMRGLFGTNPLTQEYADGDIIAHIHGDGFSLDSVTGIYRTMLLRWRFEKFMQTTELDLQPISVKAITRGIGSLLSGVKKTSIGEKLLKEFFSSYTSDDALLWTIQYGLGYLELGLRRYLEASKDKELSAKRSEQWQEVLVHYHDFRTTLEHHGELTAETTARAQRLYAKAHAVTDSPDPSTAVLLQEMKEFLTGTRFSYTKVPPL
ncbi:MAG: hypothetical protein JSR37_06145 [Verrucomicrobia bacterium]|nr:hypothetical protein [Verrucomicrobiota bacterium]MBS0636586.1 hypothetical protein [Verrucomicrobiota bacterium]